MFVLHCTVYNYCIAIEKQHEPSPKFVRTWVWGSHEHSTIEIKQIETKEKTWGWYKEFGCTKKKIRSLKIKRQRVDDHTITNRQNPKTQHPSFFTFIPSPSILQSNFLQPQFFTLHPSIEEPLLVLISVPFDKFW